jgi:hypothetical protein
VNLLPKRLGEILDRYAAPLANELPAALDVLANRMLVDDGPLSAQLDKPST